MSNSSGVGSTAVRKVIDMKANPEIRIKQHVRILLTSMRALRDVPSGVFKKAYFVQNPLIQNKDQVSNLEDMMREGRRIHPNMSLSRIFDNIHGFKLVNICFTQWKIAFIQNWIRNDMVMLQKYQRGKSAFIALRQYMKEKQSKLQEFEAQSSLLLQARVIRSWSDYVKNRKVIQMQKSRVKFLTKFFISWK